MNKPTDKGEWVSVEEIVVTITDHVKHAHKWDRDYYGDRYLNSDYGTSYKYRHAKFRLPPSKKYPRGKPKCEQYGGDQTDEEILADVSKKYQNLKMKFVLPYPQISKTSKQI